MKAFFAPAGCAVVGASRDPAKPGHQILRSMLEAGFPSDRVYPVNPREAESGPAEIAGLKVYPSLTSIPSILETAVLMVPERAMDTVLRDVEARVRARGDLEALIVTAGGYAELGTDEGRERQTRLVKAARAAGVRVMGPNCVGVIDTHSRLDTTFLHGVVHRPGLISFVSQSGAVGAWFTQMLSSEPDPVPFSKFVSLGNMADVTMAEVFDFLREDPATEVVGLYLEGTSQPRPLLASLAALAADKPVVALKTGRTQAGRQAATSHTGALAGADRIWDGALRQAGVVRAAGMEEFVDTLRLLADPGRRGTRRRSRTIVLSPLKVFLMTHAGGPGVYTMDLLADCGDLLRPAVIMPETRAALASAAPPFSSVCRPEGHLDMTASATPEEHAAAATLILGDPGVDALITLDLPTRFLSDTDVARALVGVWEDRERWLSSRAGAAEPIFLPILMQGAWTAEGRAILSRAGLPALSTPDRAVTALAAVSRLAGLKGGAEKSGEEVAVGGHAGRAGESGPIDSLSGEGGSGTLGEFESAALLAATGVAFAPFALAGTEEEVLNAAASIGYPVVLKVCSGLIPHKAAAGAIRLGLESPGELRTAFAALSARAAELLAGAAPEGFLVQKQALPGMEVIVGALRDPLFGPVVAAGRGGVRAGLDAPVSFRLAPLTRGEADRLALEVAEEALDTQALSGVIYGMARLIDSRPEVVEADLNPVIVYPRGQGCLAVDALVRVFVPDGA